MPWVDGKCPECGFEGAIQERLDGLRRLCGACLHEWKPVAIEATSEAKR